MKKIMFILLLCSVTLNAQLRLTAAQDVKLALMEDDHKNTPFTPNFFIKLSMCDQNINVSVKYEYARLYSGEFNRYGWELGYSFSLFNIKDGIFDSRKLFRITPTIGHGYLQRNDNGLLGSWELGTDIVLNVSDRVGIVCTVTYTERPEWSIWRESMYLGIQYKLN